jgi:hypothetical protein
MVAKFIGGRRNSGLGGQVREEREGRGNERGKKGGRKRRLTNQSRLGTLQHSLLPFS